jgi:hypothetical protein
MTSHVFCGTFEAESHWRELDLATLPTLRDSNATRILSAMDEMLFAFCGEGDKIITARRMDPAHVDYLHAIGFDFENNRFDLITPDALHASDVPPNIFHCLNDSQVATNISRFLLGGGTLDPFAVLSGLADTQALYGLTGR